MKKITDVLEKIDQLQSEIEKHGKLDTDLAKRIEYKFRLDWNYYSNAMEGNSLTRIETKQLMMDNVTIAGKPFKDISEMRGHDNEVLDILKMGKGQARISEKRIKSMHKAIIHEDDPAKQKFIGKWKSLNNKLTNFRGEIYDFLPYDEVPEAIHKLIDKTNAEIDAIENRKKDAKHPVLIAFEFHLEYVHIHPFYDGNGRTARLLTNLLLINFGYPPFLLSIKTKDTYNRILGEIQGYGGNENDFHQFLGELLIESQQLVLDAIAGKDISDDDDVDKEIALFKQSLSKNSVDLKVKNDAVIAQVFIDSIRPLFELFLNKQKQFDDLFNNKKIESLIRGTFKESKGLEYFDDWVEHVKLQESSISDNLHDGKVNYELSFRLNDTRSFRLRIAFRGFNKGGVHVFDEYSEIGIVFNKYDYCVGGDKLQEKYKKKYSQSYTEQEMIEIVNEKTKQFLEKLKNKLKK